MNDIRLRAVMAAKAAIQFLARNGGQLHRKTFLGDRIYRLSQIGAFRNFVEIGTWNGRGSTKCFMDGLLFRHDDSVLYSLESNRDLYQRALEYWRPVLATQTGAKKLKLIYGRIMEISELLTCDEIPSEIRSELPHYLRWRESDMFDYDRSPNMIDALPAQIDVLLLDGGEFSTYAEFRQLRERTGVILLDDTKLLKCRKIREELLEDNAWRVVYDLPDERSGNLIACRRDRYRYLADNL